ncbi:Oidioi.mRNA.OKI2018_I69.chr2.g7869.t1.cds [Oikopleura dioica]|uniref:Oidioi.mRNA.OKI2018_I69.chr2.g7869.t1.cds n=1 Tax=Oikopleura dioica TaxID=34765 RepID=A0ABN7TDD6_OIKDI|nr:Oidioi.mRNA.OKI2018_I69.chr2.g7869.t1.cds [Oikopleura dioica]
MEGTKERYTLIPYCTPFGHVVDFKPAVISKCQGSKWEGAGKKIKKKFRDPTFDATKPSSSKNQEFFEIEYRSFENFILYWNPSAWMTRQIMIAEVYRLSLHLKSKSPSKKYLVMMDNCSSHKKLPMLDNLEFVYFQPGCTGWHPGFSIVKNGS